MFVITFMYRHRFLLIVTLLGLAVLLLPHIVVACVRPPTPTVLQAYEDSEVVIIARAISVEKTADESQKAMTNSLVSATTLEVEKVFKGKLLVGDKLVFGQGNGIRCTWVFYGEDVGTQYLLYLYSPPEGGKVWYEFGMGRSRSLENAGDDLLYLNNIDKLRGRTRVSGVLGEDGLAGLSREGQTIHIIGRTKIYTTTTDKDGVYELYDLPPGRYVLEPVLKFGWKVNDFEVTRELTRSERMHGLPPSNRIAFTLRPRKHFGIDIRLKLSNHVSGTIYDSNSKPMRRVCVSLVPLNDERFLACNSITDDRGRFEIDSVEAGDYLIILNYVNKLTTEMPFPKLYYPGVTQREKAKPTTVKHGETLTDLDVVIRLVR